MRVIIGSQPHKFSLFLPPPHRHAKSGEHISYRVGSQLCFILKVMNDPHNLVTKLHRIMMRKTAPLAYQCAAM